MCEFERVVEFLLTLGLVFVVDTFRRALGTFLEYLERIGDETRCAECSREDASSGDNGDERGGGVDGEGENLIGNVDETGRSGAEVEEEGENAHVGEECEGGGLREGGQNESRSLNEERFLFEDEMNYEDYAFESVDGIPVSLPLAVVTPFDAVVEFQNVLAGALREAGPELQVSSETTDKIMTIIHSECVNYINEGSELAHQEHSWRSCVFYKELDLLNKYFRFVKDKAPFEEL